MSDITEYDDSETEAILPLGDEAVASLAAVTTIGDNTGSPTTPWSLLTPITTAPKSASPFPSADSAHVRPATPSSVTVRFPSVTTPTSVVSLNPFGSQSPEEESAASLIPLLSSDSSRPVTPTTPAGRSFFSLSSRTLVVPVNSQELPLSPPLPLTASRPRSHSLAAPEYVQHAFQPNIITTLLTRNISASTVRTTLVNTEMREATQLPHELESPGASAASITVGYV